MWQKEVWENKKKNLGQGRETRVTWAGPGPWQWERKSCAVVTARARRQLMYAGHRKAELRRRHSLWDLCVVLTWSQRCFPASVPLHTRWSKTEWADWRRSTITYSRPGCDPPGPWRLWCTNRRDPANIRWAYARELLVLLLQNIPSSLFSNRFIPLLRETCHFQLGTRREPDSPQRTQSLLQLCWLLVLSLHWCACVCTCGSVQQGANTHAPAVWTQGQLSPSLAQAMPSNTSSVGTSVCQPLSLRPPASHMHRGIMGRWVWLLVVAGHRHSIGPASVIHPSATFPTHRMEKHPGVFSLFHYTCWRSTSLLGINPSPQWTVTSLRSCCFHWKTGLKWDESPLLSPDITEILRSHG